MRKFLILIFVFALVVAMAVPSFASTVLDGYALPAPPDAFFSNGEYRYLGMKGDNYVLLVSTGCSVLFDSAGVFYQDGYKLWIWTLTDGVWVYSAGDRFGYNKNIDYIDNIIWCSHDVLYKSDKTTVFLYGSDFAFCEGSPCPATDANKDNVCDDCGFEFAVPRDYSPFTVKKFMNHIGQILNFAVSWVGNVGSTILDQPLLLAFCALPLCGIGIGVFRRLRGVN